MRLRSLYIKGFKSFALETVLHFEDSVTGIVGPNGSGKSNIVDAIRWVLGEQSNKELRLESMGDIIFNGTKTRRESGLAQVSLTFDNTKNIIPTEYQSVTISRLLYRSGESEYRLNNVPCRLKDIRSLFIDTGIGSNSYAIIALGMVDDILDNKDNARRRMFEQAAGISKYKTRKRETLNKLKLTDVDLDRVEDLLHEIDSNLKSLEKQARRTKKYFSVKEEYKKLSIQFALRSVNSFQDQYNTQGHALAAEEDKYRALVTQINVEEAEIAEIKSKNLTSEQYVSERQRTLNEIVNKIRESENNKNLSTQKLDFTLQEISKLSAKVISSRQSINLFQIEIAKLNTRLNHEIEKKVRLEKDKNLAHSEYTRIKESFQKVRTEIDAITRKKNELRERVYEREKEQAIMENNLINFRTESKTLLEQIKGLESEKKVLSGDQNLLKSEIDKIKTSLSEAESLKNQKEKDIENIRREIQMGKDRLSVLFRKRDAMANEVDLLKSMINSFEGFPSSIKYLHENWDREAVIFSDVIDVQDSYKNIIEQHLEPYLNYFIVSNMGHAKAAIHLLTGSQQGRAGFFLLEKYGPINNELVPKHPQVFPAIQVVETQDIYLPLVSSLLRGVYIFTGSQDNLEWIELDGIDTLISQDGTYIRKKHSISGGSVGLFDGKRIGRKTNVKKLESKLSEWEVEINQLKKNVQDLEYTLQSLKKAEAGKSLEDIRKEYQHLHDQHIRGQSVLENLENTLKRYFDKLNRLKDDILKTEKSLERHIHDKEKEQLELTSLSGKDLFSDDEIDELTEKVNRSGESYNALNIEFIKQQNLISSLEKERDYKEERSTELIKVSESDQVNISILEKEKEKLTLTIDQLGQDLMKMYSDRDGKKVQLSEAEQNYYSSRNVIYEREEELRKRNRALQQIQVRINEMKEEYNHIRFKLSGISERLKIEFNVTLNEIINDPIDDTLNFEELDMYLGKLKSRLENFGEINPMAVTAYDEMKDRFESIITQRNDILEAKESLLMTIKEIETTATEQFMNAFENVREHFIMVFRSLFTEDDTCDLILLDKDNPLESEIEIIAQPKSKKPKSLSQLSGGEKTLTATALLFALYLLKPAPFCIFDEVDAPLDDVNIQKFNKIIQKFSKDSQFIIVTHNKSTMAEVDVLYGVYMEEPGVSGLTQVDFRSYEHQAIHDVL